MKTCTVKELMVPLSEYAAVSEDATLLDAVLALEEAQERFDRERYRHRAVLVLDQDHHVVGKLSQHDVIRALEPNYKKIEKEEQGVFKKFGLSDIFVKRVLEEYCLWEKPLENLCKKAVSQKVKQFMCTPTEAEYVEADATLDEAIHRMIVGEHQSLLVTREGKIVGILRLTDLFEMIFKALKEC